jgi:hypothetical protein
MESDALNVGIACGVIAFIAILVMLWLSAKAYPLLSCRRWIRRPSASPHIADIPLHCREPPQRATS